MFKKGNIPWNKGKSGYKMPPASEERKKKISAAHKGKSFIKFTPKMRKKWSETAKKYGFGKWAKGRKNPFLSKINKERPSEKHWNWQGGKTSLVSRIRNSLEYRQWRNDVFTRDNFTCQECGDNKGRNLEAHHRISMSNILRYYKIKTLKEALDCKMIWDMDNGLTLCANCHKNTNNYGEKAKIDSQSFIRSMRINLPKVYAKLAI